MAIVGRNDRPDPIDDIRQHRHVDSGTAVRSFADSVAPGGWRPDGRIMVRQVVRPQPR